jgi:hypothetical protein
VDDLIAPLSELPANASAGRARHTVIAMPLKSIAQIADT